MTPVHPRACGERVENIAAKITLAGSSPRLRGTHHRCNRVDARRRFIPAPAGNAQVPTPPLTRNTVHPRACGERATADLAGGPHAGSSPRLRGTREWLDPGSASYRFIPAPAGNAYIGRLISWVGAVHPRACGECHLYPILAAYLSGSSPRLRGTHRMVLEITTQIRFIPAPAGNATKPSRACRAAPVHPRACGERARRGLLPWRDDGSSPRLRGTRSRRGGAQRHVRFIPAPAGNAFIKLTGTPEVAVHPRACGERCGLAIDHFNGVGSSPRLRGTRSA